MAIQYPAKFFDQLNVRLKYLPFFFHLKTFCSYLLNRFMDIFFKNRVNSWLKDRKKRTEINLKTKD